MDHPEHSESMSTATIATAKRIREVRAPMATGALHPMAGSASACRHGTVLPTGMSPGVDGRGSCRATGLRSSLAGGHGLPVPPQLTGSVLADMHGIMPEARSVRISRSASWAPHFGYRTN